MEAIHFEAEDEVIWLVEDRSTIEVCRARPDAAFSTIQVELFWG
jgi:hypothetical protein